MQYKLIFLLKKCAKLPTFFQQEKKWELDTVLARTVNILTTNELVKLTMLWTTGPWKKVKHPGKKTCIGISNVIIGINMNGVW